MRAPSAHRDERRGAARGRRRFVVVRRRARAHFGVSFDIRKGEIRAIIGPNGAGKTSMLNVINGFYQPQAGRITFKGKARTAMRPYAAASAAASPAPSRTSRCFAA